MAKVPLRSEDRNESTKEKNKTKDTTAHISISFKHFHGNQLPGQNFDDWHNDDRLLDTLNVLHNVTSHNITDLQSSNRITLYKSFPIKSVNEFDIPDGLDKEMNWGTIKNIGGQKARIVGFLEGSVFYIVFLDKYHLFYKSKR